MAKMVLLLPHYVTLNTLLMLSHHTTTSEWGKSDKMATTETLYKALFPSIRWLAVMLAFQNIKVWCHLAWIQSLKVRVGEVVGQKVRQCPLYIRTIQRHLWRYLTEIVTILSHTLRNKQVGLSASVQGRWGRTRNVPCQTSPIAVINAFLFLR